MTRRFLSSILLLSMFFVTIIWVPTAPLWDSNSPGVIDSPPSGITGNDQINPLEEVDSKVKDFFESTGGLPQDGVLDPVIVEQTGYSVSGQLYARTDTSENTAYDLPIDTIHSWKASEADVNVTDLTRLYAVNGTFDEGVPGENVNPNGTIDAFPYGWISSSNTTDSTTTQRSTYEQIGSYYVSVENEGKSIGTGSNLRFQHALGTEVLWNQSIDNSPYAEEFSFSVDYLYQRGPLDIALGSSISLEARLDGVVYWSISLPSLAARDQWYSSGDITFSVPGAPSVLSFEIGLSINVTESLNPDDYGYIHANYITVHLDNVAIKSTTAPEFSAVDLEFHAGGYTAAIIGSLGVGFASITNPLYWSSPTVSTFITSNTSVSFNFESRLLAHRYTNSSYATDVTKQGVAFTTSIGESSDLTFYTYIGYFGDYENPGLQIQYPSDWENTTIYDPSPTDVSGSCTFDSNSVHVPSSLMDRLGWWQIQVESPNYAKSIQSQIFDATWISEDTFRIGNSTRSLVEIGTALETMNAISNVNVTWYTPSLTVWNTELLSGVLGQVTSSTYTFNPGSSPAGEWWIEVYWTNGTEVAYGRIRFEVHHAAVLAATPPEIQTDAGLVIKALVTYSDEDSGAYLLDASVTLEGNWSGSSIPFVANPVQNRWEADFDTSITGEGDFVIIVNATRPYYDDISCQIVVHSTRVTRLTSQNAPWTAAEYGENVTLQFRYEGYNYGTESWTGIQNESDISVSVNWTAGYWSVVEDIAPGVFFVEIDTSILYSETWLLNTTFSKPNHESRTVLLTLIISPTASSLTIFETIFTRVDINTSYTINMTYRDYKGQPLTGADVVVDSITPAAGLAYDPVTEIPSEPGNYTTSLTPHAPGVFTIRFVANITNAENATTVFVLVVNDVKTVLDIPGSESQEIGLTDFFNTTFRFKLENGTGVENANISIVYSGGVPGALSWDWVEIGLGDYSVEFSSTSSGTYLITIAASKPYHQSASDAFFLVIREISTNFISLNGTADLVSFGKDYRLSVSYTNGTGHGLAGANVTIESVTSDSTLDKGTTLPGAPGIYSILLTPQAADTFTILIRAKLDNHQTQFVLFTLTATSIATTLSVLNSSTSISLDQNFTVTLRFQDEDSIGLENAIISIQNPPTGVAFSQVTNLTEGYYLVTITPLEIGTFDIVFSASKPGYQTDYASFTLTATIIRTDLAIDLSSSSIIYGQQHDIVVLYTRIDTGKNITGASINVQTSTGDLQWDYSEEVDGGYRITLDPQKAGNWTLYIYASLGTTHEESSTQFQLTVVPISISINFVTELEAMENRPFDIVIKLTNDRTNDTIDDALVWYRFSVSKAGLFREMNSTGVTGEYFVRLSVPLFADSIYRLEINVEKENYVLEEII
ncbi:MAG: hypothetical protein PVJ05_10970, partial [Candidatus Thorarchaeota archaeon]